MPPPLVDSPKCPRCSLVGICLPDETRLLQLREQRSEDGVGGPHRPEASEETPSPRHGYMVPALSRRDGGGAITAERDEYDPPSAA